MTYPEQPVPSASDTGAVIIHSDDTLTTSGSSVASGFGPKEISIVVNVTVAPTGGSPTLQFTIQEVDPGDKTTPFGPTASTVSITGVGLYTATLRTTTAGTVLVSWTIGGSTPSFTGVYSTVVSKVGTPTTASGSVAVDISTTSTGAVKITDGTNNAAVKAASTPAVATDQALVVAISPNNSITASNPSVGTTGSAVPASATQIGGTDGTNLQAPHVFDADSGGGTQYVLGTILRKSASGGSVEAGTSSDPLRIDPTGTTTQPVSGTVTANVGTTGGLALDGTLTGGTQTTRITDGTNTAAVKAASTAPLATDPALVVAISPNSSITATNPSVGTNNAAAPSSSTQVGGTDGTNLQASHVFDADSGAGTQYVLGTILRKSASGGSVEAGTASDPLRIDPTGTTTQPVSGTVTANVGTTGGLALDATLTGGTTKAIVRGGTKGATTPADVTSTAEGVDHQALDVQIYHGGTAKDPTQIRALTNADVVTAEVSKWIGSTAPTVGQKTSANSLPVVIASDQSAVTVTGTITDPSIGTTGSAVPASATQIGGSDGTNLQAPRVFDADSGAGTQYVLGTILRKSASGGSVEAGTASDPLRVDPTGTTTQPVSGTVTANVGTTGGLALDATLTGGTAKAIVRGGTKGATTPADVTSTAEGADHQALDVQIYHGGTAKDPTQIRALTNADVVSDEITKWIGSTAPTVGQKTSANSLPVVIASDQSAVTITGTVTATNPSVGTNNAAIPTSSTQVGGSDGTNLQAARVFDADSGAGTQYVLGTILRKSASGGSVEAGTASDPLRVDPTGTTTQPISAASLPLPTGAATSANQTTLGSQTTKINDGTNTAAVKAASTAAAATDPALVVAISPNNTVAVSGTVTANVGTTGGLALDATLTGGTAKSIVRGGAKGATVAADVTSTAEGADHQALDVQIYHGGVAKDPTQIRALTNADVVSSEVTKWIGSTAPTVGQKTSANSLPVVIASDQSAVPVSGTVTANIGTTGGLALDATLTGGTTKAIVRGGAKGATVAADVTSTAEGADHQSLDVQIYHGGTAKDPTQIRALTNADVVSSEVTKWIGSTAPTVGQKTSANSIPTVIASDQSAVPVSGTVTANQGTAAALGSAWPVKVTDGTNTLPTGDAVSRAIFEKITDGTNTAAVSATTALRVNIPDAADVFGQLVVGQRIAQIQITFNALAPASLVTVSTSGTGSTSGPSNGQGSFSTGSGATAQATGVTTNSVAYSPHQELFSAFTASFTSPSAASSYQRIGLYNATDGFAFGYNGLNFGLWTRFNTTDTFTAQSSWNGDTCLGGGTSKFRRAGSAEALAPNLINLYRIRFGWLGIAPVVFEILSPDGDWVTVHAVRYPNQGISVSLTNPNLPMTVDVSKTASDGAILTISSGCWVSGTTAGAVPNFVGTGTIASNGASVLIPTAGVSALTLSMSGSWVGTLAFQYSVDGVNWKTDVVYDQTTGAFISSTTTNKTIEAPIASYRQYRVFATAWTSGIATILYSTSQGANWIHTQTLLTDGSSNGPAAVKAASTLAVAADPALVVALSPNSAVSPGSDRTAAGSITGVNQTVAISTQGVSNTAFQFSGTWTATLVFEGTVDNTTWFAIPAFQVGLGGGGLTTLTISTTHNNIYRVPSPGFLQVRVRCTAYTSGTATVTVEASAGSISPVLTGFVDPNNYTTTTLGSGVQFVGGLTSTGGFDVIFVRVSSDQSSAASGLKVQWSHDGTSLTVDAEQQFTYTGGIVTLYQFRIRGPFYRILYTNGGTGQATFELSAALKAATPDGTVLPGQQEGLYEFTRPTAIAGKDSGSIYRAIRSGTDGNLSTNRTVTANVNAPSGAATLTTDGLGTVSAQVTGSWTGTLVFEGSVDGTNFATVPATAIGGAAGASQVASTTANGMWSLATGGLASVRLRASALSSGTAVMTLVGSPSGSTTKSINPAVTITSPSAGAAGLYAFVSPFGTLRTSSEGPALFRDAFDGAYFDTVNTWVVNSNNGGSVAPVSGQATFTVGTTASAFAELYSQVSLAPSGLGFLALGCVVKLEVAAITNNHRFWGFGVTGSTATEQLLNAIGFEVETDGILYAVVYVNGTRTAQALTKPTDGAQHRYVVIVRGDLIFWYQDGLEVPVASLSYSAPNVTALPVRFHCFNLASPPGSAPTFTVTGVGVQDTTPSSLALSDGAYPWRKASVKPASTAATTSDSALVVAVSPNTPVAAVPTSDAFQTDDLSIVRQLMEALLLEHQITNLLLVKLVSSAGVTITQRELDALKLVKGQVN